MLIAMTLVTAFVVCAAEIVWRRRQEADLRRRWRDRRREPWHLT
jgi:hypothetical protein